MDNLTIHIFRAKVNKKLTLSFETFESIFLLKSKKRNWGFYKT